MKSCQDLCNPVRNKEKSERMNFKSKHALWEMRHEKWCALESVEIGHMSDSEEDFNIIIDVWIFDSMINENFNCLSNSHFHGPFIR